MAHRLTEDEVKTALEGLPEWSGGPAGIRRTAEADSFLGGIAWVDAVAQAAEAADHHPDIDIRWRTVAFTLVTHSAGGVTDRDISLARAIDEIISG